MGKRMKVLGKRRSMVIVTLAVVLLAVGAWIGSGANFSKTEAASANNVISAGFVDLTSTGLTADIGPLAPGMSRSGTATVENAGDVEGHFYLKVVKVSEVAGADPNNPGDSRLLSSALRLYLTPFVGTELPGYYTLADLAAGSEFDCGILPAADTNPGSGPDVGTVTLRAMFPDSDQGTTNRGTDNGFMNATVTVNLVWTVVSTGN